MFELKPKSSIPKSAYIALSISGLVFIILIWSILSYGGLIKPIFLSDPLSTLKNVFNLIFEEGILKDALVSIGRVFAGFVLAIIVGIPLGIFCGIYKPIEAFIESNISFLRYIPVAAFIPLAILWFGVSEIEKIFLIFIGVLPYTVLYVSTAAANVEKEYLEVAATLGAKNRELLTKVIVPRALPNIWDICRIEMGGAWAFVILAEVVAANSGLGYRLVLAQRFLHTTDIFSVIMLIGLIGLIIDFLFKISYNKLFPWAEKSKSK
jgi:NitT/TauT family transport system permease protein